MGIAPHTGRNAALIDLAADIPAPILADLLGLHANTAVKWSRITGRDWASYIAARDTTANVGTPAAHVRTPPRITEG